MLAEAACALAVRGLAPVDELGPRPASRAALVPARRTRRPGTMVLAYEIGPSGALGGAGIQAYLRTGPWARLVGYHSTLIATEPSARLTVSDAPGRAVDAVGDLPASGDGWAGWSLTLDTPLEAPRPPDGPSPPGEPPVALLAKVCPPQAGEAAGSGHLRLASNAALAAAVAGQPYARSLNSTVDALLASGAVSTANPAVTDARRLAGPAHRAGGLPAPWASVLDRDRPRQVPHRKPVVVPAAAVVTPAAQVTVAALIPGRHSFLVAAHVVPWNPVAPATRLRPGDNSRLAWWATDDRDRDYIGRFAFASLADRERFGPPADIRADVAIVFRPPPRPGGHHPDRGGRMSDQPWWTAAPAVEGIIGCGGEPHRLRWDHGQLHAADHPDPDGERLLTALGGPTAPCLRVLQLWAGHGNDVRALTLGSRGHDDQPAVDVAAVARLTPRFLPRSTQRPPAGVAHLIPSYMDLTLEARWSSWLEVLELLNLPAALQVRWAAAVAATLLDLVPSAAAGPRPPTPDLRANPIVMTTRDLERSAGAIALAILDSALVARARRALTRMVGPSTSIRVSVLAPDGAPTIRHTPHEISVALRHDWLTRVWGRDLTHVGDAFVLDAVEHGADHQTLTLLTDAGDRTIKLSELPPAPAVARSDV